MRYLSPCAVVYKLLYFTRSYIEIGVVGLYFCLYPCCMTMKIILAIQNRTGPGTPWPHQGGSPLPGTGSRTPSCGSPACAPGIPYMEKKGDLPRYRKSKFANRRYEKIKGGRPSARKFYSTVRSTQKTHSARLRAVGQMVQEKVSRCVLRRLPVQGPYRA